MKEPVHTKAAVRTRLVGYLVRHTTCYFALAPWCAGWRDFAITAGRSDSRSRRPNCAYRWTRWPEVWVAGPRHRDFSRQVHERLGGEVRPDGTRQLRTRTRYLSSSPCSNRQIKLTGGQFEGVTYLESLPRSRPNPAERRCEASPRSLPRLPQ